MAMNKSKSLPWDEVEKAINKEIEWLERTIVDSLLIMKRKFAINVFLEKLQF